MSIPKCNIPHYGLRNLHFEQTSDDTRACQCLILWIIFYNIGNSYLIACHQKKYAVPSEGEIIGQIKWHMKKYLHL